MANANKPINGNGLLYIWQKFLTKLTGKVDKVEGKDLSTNDLTNALKANYDAAYTHSQEGHAPAAAEKNVIVGVQKNGVDVAVDATTRKVNIAVPTKTSELSNDSGFITSGDIPEGAAASTTVPKMDGVAAVGTEMAFARGDHTHPSDTTKVDKVEGKGLSTEDYTTAEKAKLTGIEDGANNYTHPAHTAKTNGLYKVTVDAQGHVSAAIAATKADITGLGIPEQDTTYEKVTATADGLMSAADKAKLDAFGAASEYAKKSDLANVYVYKGSVATYADLPSIGLTAGDVYNVEADGMNYAWTGTAWDALGMVLEIEYLTNAEIDEIIGA